MHTSIAVYQQKIVAQQTALDYDETTVAFLAKSSPLHDQLWTQFAYSKIKSKKREKKKKRVKKNNRTKEKRRKSKNKKKTNSLVYLRSQIYNKLWAI